VAGIRARRARDIGVRVNWDIHGFAAVAIVNERSCTYNGIVRKN